MRNQTVVATIGATQEQIATAIRQQVAVIGEIELRGNFEKLKLGAMVSEAVKILKLEGAAGRGVGHAGDGALGWWGEVCPKRDSGEPVIAYRTVMRWKQAAENLPQLMGVGVMKRDKVLALLAENPEEAVGKDAKILASAEKMANGMTMRQMLLWGGDEEAKPKSNRGIMAGTKADLSGRNLTDTATAARAVWSKVIVTANQTMPALKAGAALLNINDVKDALATLDTLKEILNARWDELKRGNRW